MNAKPAQPNRPLAKIGRLLVVLASFLRPDATFAEPPSMADDGSVQVFRHLGWVRSSNGAENSVFLVGFKNSYSVQFGLPRDEQHRNNWSNSGANAWLLGADGIAAPPLQGPPQWHGPVFVATHGPPMATADFGFEGTIPGTNLVAVVLRLGETTYIFKIPPATPGLPWRAQRAVDRMSNFAPDAIEKYESQPIKTRKSNKGEVAMQLNELTEQLRELGFTVKWDRGLKRYVVVR